MKCKGFGRIAIHVCDFNGVQRGNYIGEEPIKRTEVKVKVGKFKNRKAAGKDEVTGEMIKGWRWMKSGSCAI